MGSDHPHLAIVCPACGGAGAVANVAVHQSRELARWFRVTLLSDSLPAARVDDVAFHRLNPPRFDWLRRYGHVPREAAFAWAAKSALRWIHASTPVDMVLCHGHAAAALAAWPLKRSQGIPYAMVTHGDIFERPKGTYDRRLTWFYRRTTPPAYRHADLVIALSPHMRDMALRGGASPERVVVIPNGIDPAEIGLAGTMEPVPRERSGPLQLLYVGRLSVEKGVDVLIEAAALLKARGVAFHLRIAGDGPESERLRQQVAQSGLNGLVEFLGPVPRLQLGALYRSADVVCVPSRSDPLPTVVLEAMSAGTPVVGTDTGGIPFVVENGVTGLVCRADNNAALADALSRFATEPGLGGRMGGEGQQRVAREFTWPAIAESLSSALRAILRNLAPV